MLEQYITPKEVGERLKVPVRTVFDWIYKGQLPAIKAGRQWRIKEADVLAFLEASTKKPTPRVGTPRRDQPAAPAQRPARTKRTG
jgi:excisionase family DNA binding protein